MGAAHPKWLEVFLPPAVSDRPLTLDGLCEVPVSPGGRLLGARQPELLEGCVEEMYSCRSRTASLVDEASPACLSFGGARCPLSVACCPSKLPSPLRDPVRFPQDVSETRKTVDFLRWSLLLVRILMLPLDSACGSYEE